MLSKELCRDSDSANGPQTARNFVVGHIGLSLLQIGFKLPELPAILYSSLLYPKFGLLLIRDTILIIKQVINYLQLPSPTSTL